MTNAIFNWVPQAGIIAQEVWYGKLSVVGSTFPPTTGWNAGTNLYSAIANNATFNNLDENTKYRFLVRSHCVSGDSSWAEYDGYKLTCPTVSLSSTSSSVTVNLSILNEIEFSSIVSGIKIDLVPVSSGVTLASTTLSGPFSSTATYTFTSLSASTSYDIVVSAIINGVNTSCSTTNITTPAALVCPVLTYTTTNITLTSFDITPTNLAGGDTYDISLDNGVTYILTGLTAVTTVSGLSQSTTYNIVLRRNCANTLTSTTTNQNVSTLTPNLIVAAANNINIVGLTGITGLPPAYATLNLPSGSQVSTYVASLASGTLSVQVALGVGAPPSKIDIMINNSVIACSAASSTGTYTFSIPTINYPSQLKVAIHLGTC